MQDGFLKAEDVSYLITPTVKAFLERDAISLLAVSGLTMSGALLRKDEGI